MFEVDGLLESCDDGVCAATGCDSKGLLIGSTNSESGIASSGLISRGVDVRGDELIVEPAIEIHVSIEHAMLSVVILSIEHAMLSVVILKLQRLRKLEKLRKIETKHEQETAQFSLFAANAEKLMNFGATNMMLHPGKAPNRRKVA